MIVITTPTGDIGARVLHRVLEGADAVRVILRDASKLPERIRDKVDVIEGSHADAEAIGRALSGATRVFWLPPGSPSSQGPEAAYVEFSRPFCEALPSSDVTHVVGVTALGRGWSTPAGHVTASLTMDDTIAGTGVAYRGLACASLMDNLLRQVGPIRDGGVFYQPTPGDLKLPHVAKSDVADVAARLLLSADWRGVEELPLSGPEDMSFEEMAGIVSDVLGRPIRFEAMPMDAYEEMMLENGMSAGMAASTVQMLTAKNEGMDTMVRPIPRGDTPTTFLDWCETELKPAVAG